MNPTGCPRTHTPKPGAIRQHVVTRLGESCRLHIAGGGRTFLEQGGSPGVREAASALGRRGAQEAHARETLQKQSPSSPEGPMEDRDTQN